MRKGSAPLLLLLIGVVVAVIATIYFKRPAITSTVQAPPENQCASADYYFKVFQDGFGKSTTITQNKSENWTISDITWKRDPKEPFISYPGQTVLYIDVPGRIPQDVNNAYQSTVEREILKLGFIKVDSNTISGKEPAQNTTWWRYGYKKGDILTIISVGNDTSVIDPNKTFIGFQCGVVDSKYDKIYSELLSSTDVQNELKRSYGPNGLGNMDLSIWGIHQNDVVETDIGSVDYASGHGLWLHKEGGVWKSFYVGQQGPTCSLLESFHVEPGVRCTPPGDFGLGETR